MSKAKPKPARDGNAREVETLTMLEWSEADHRIGERIARFLGYTQYVYTSTSALWGLFCLRENPEHATPADLTPLIVGGRPIERRQNACIINTRELGFLIVHDCEDYGLDGRGHYMGRRR